MPNAETPCLRITEWHRRDGNHNGNLWKAFPRKMEFFFENFVELEFVGQIYGSGFPYQRLSWLVIVDWIIFIQDRKCECGVGNKINQNILVHTIHLVERETVRELGCFSFFLRRFDDQVIFVEVFGNQKFFAIWLLLSSITRELTTLTNLRLSEFRLTFATHSTNR